MNIKEIKELIEIIDNSNLTVFEYENSGEKLVLKKEANIVVPEPVCNNIQRATQVISENTAEKEIAIDETEKKTDNNLIEITSPIVGTFYEAPSPGSKPFVNVGDKVKKGDVLCIIEAMKLMNEITAEFDCEIVKILVKNEEMVEYGKPLFLVKPL